VVYGDVAGERVLGLAVLAAQPAGVAHAREVLRLQVHGVRQNSISCFKRIFLLNLVFERIFLKISLPKQINFSATYGRETSKS
jgi:hypothetical protein